MFSQLFAPIRVWGKKSPKFCKACGIVWVAALLLSYAAILCVMPVYLASWFAGKELKELGGIGQFLVYFGLAFTVFLLGALRFYFRHLFIDLADKWDRKSSEEGKEEVRYCVSVSLYVVSGLLASLAWLGFTFVPGLFSLAVAEAQLTGDLLRLVGTANEAVMGSLLLIMFTPARKYSIALSVPLLLSFIAIILGPLARHHACRALHIDNTRRRCSRRVLKILETEIERNSELIAALKEEEKGPSLTDPELGRTLLGLRSVAEEMIANLKTARDRVDEIVREDETPVI